VESARTRDRDNCIHCTGVPESPRDAGRCAVGDNPLGRANSHM